MMLLRVLVVSLTLSSCGWGKKAEEVGGQVLEGLFQYIQTQLVEYFITNAASMIVALGLTDTAAEDPLLYAEEENIGDSLLFTGVALGVVDCEVADTLLTGLERMQDVHGGYLVRYNPLPDEYKENQVSRDGGTGAMFGLIRVQKRCPGTIAERADKVMQRWREAVGSQALLHPKSKAVITPTYKFFRDVAYGKGMNAAEYAIYATSNLVTVEGIKKNKTACYPVHLETLQLLTMEMQGVKLAEVDKNKWCEVTNDMGLMLTDWYCGRNNEKIKAWLKNPENSQHVYMHQRCSWEVPDVGHLSSPRVDYLVMYRLMEEGSNPW